MRKILLAVDGSDSCNKAVGKVVELTKDLEAEVTIITIVEEKPSLQVSSKQKIDEEFSKMEEIREEAEQIAEKCAASFNTHDRVTTLVKEGNAAEAICEKANEEDYDFVVVADMGKGAVKKFLLGSTTEKVVRHCNKSVLVVK